MISFYNISLIVLMCLLGSLGTIGFKAANKKPIFINPTLYIGGFFYFISSLINIYLLKFNDYSVILPLSSLTFIFTLFLAKVFFKEIISLQKILGIIIIMVGVTFVAVA